MRWLWRHKAILAWVVLASVTALAIRQNYSAIQKINQEGVERRDQSCTISERKQLTDVRQLQRVYLYLLKLSPSEARSPINMAIRQSLPIAEGEAHQDDAPDFCDEPHVGLPEPDQCVPPRPVALGGKWGSPPCLNRKERR